MDSEGFKLCRKGAEVSRAAEEAVEFGDHDGVDLSSPN
jgi:hypothetical protein